LHDQIVALDDQIVALDDQIVATNTQLLVCSHRVARKIPFEHILTIIIGFGKNAVLLCKLEYFKKTQYGLAGLGEVFWAVKRFRAGSLARVETPPSVFWLYIGVGVGADKQIGVVSVTNDVRTPAGVFALQCRTDFDIQRTKVSDPSGRVQQDLPDNG
jgi:hypothetical protein